MGKVGEKKHKRGHRKTKRLKPGSIIKAGLLLLTERSVKGKGTRMRLPRLYLIPYLIFFIIPEAKNDSDNPSQLFPSMIADPRPGTLSTDWTASNTASGVALTQLWYQKRAALGPIPG